MLGGGLIVSSSSNARCDAADARAQFLAPGARFDSRHNRLAPLGLAYVSGSSGLRIGEATFFGGILVVVLVVVNFVGVNSVVLGIEQSVMRAILSPICLGTKSIATHAP